jgi:hypothetical protein
MKLADLLTILDQCAEPRDAAQAARAMAEFIGRADVAARVGKITTPPKIGRPPGRGGVFVQAFAVSHFRRFRDFEATARLFPMIPRARLDEICFHTPGAISRQLAKARQKYPDF